MVVSCFWVSFLLLLFVALFFLSLSTSGTPLLYFGTLLTFPIYIL
jgi:hypothetical protein